MTTSKNFFEDLLFDTKFMKFFAKKDNFLVGLLMSASYSHT